MQDTRSPGKVCWAADLGQPLFSCQFVPGLSHALAVGGKGPDIIILDTQGSANQLHGHSNGNIPFEIDCQAIR